jgi:8-oxo-dGTP pyrophosphatase MutT (NUDIX family)
VFVHPRNPEAGIQGPADTLDIRESPEAGVLREVREETGLTDLALGEQERDMTDYGHAEIHLRRFYHVLCTGEPPDTWRYFEQYPSRSPREPIPFGVF